MNKITKRLRKALHGNAKGFTLIELLVVLGILAVIGGIVALKSLSQNSSWQQC
jgi:prepilin-type N-terminal cleavage/methylation domain-containing protein